MIKLIKEKSAKALCTNFSLMDQNSQPLVDKNLYALPTYIRKNHKHIEQISLLQLIFGNVAPGCTYLFNREVQKIYLDIHNTNVVHDHQIMLISTNIGKVIYLNEELISYRLHPNNSIGFSKKSHKIQTELRKPKKEPVMSSFFKQMNGFYSVRHLYFYLFLYQLRIPALAEMIRKWLTGK
jgi:N12 class adenine-specific DNA methylase